MLDFVRKTRELLDIKIHNFANFTLDAEFEMLIRLDVLGINHRHLPNETFSNLEKITVIMDHLLSLRERDLRLIQPSDISRVLTLLEHYSEGFKCEWKNEICRKMYCVIVELPHKW